MHISYLPGGCLIRLRFWLSLVLLGAAIHGRAAVLQHSDVVFMYQADPATYEQYGATVLAWGGKPTARSSQENTHLRVFGSVGMVTEFARYYERFPDTYRAGLCQDIQGQTVKVPWLTDHQHKGVPYWWCCTQQPQFRQFLRERVIETVKAGAGGVHIDDHMGTAGGLWLGICFCDQCVDGFRSYLQSLPREKLEALGIDRPQNYNYRNVVRRWLADDGKRQTTQHPLWAEWTIYQCRAAAAFMHELRELAAQTAGHPVPIGANAGLLWPRHLADYRSLDLFSAETDHHAQSEQLSDRPLFAYRMADAVDRPYAATASGADWAYIKERNLPGLVRGWIALSYAAGQCLMAPHRQWCYTPEKGTHWYAGPAEKFAPLYRFVRQHADCFDGYDTHADLALLMPHRAFLKNPNRWFEISDELARRNVSYRLLLAGDEIVDHPLTAAALSSAGALLAPVPDELMTGDRQLLLEQEKGRPSFKTVAEALAAIHPAVALEGDRPVRILPRVKTGSAVVHLLNYGYNRSRDDVDSLSKVRLRIDLRALGLDARSSCAFLAPGQPSQSLTVSNGTVEVPELGLWGMLRL